jgi:hypothetical protein
VRKEHPEYIDRTMEQYIDQVKLSEEKMELLEDIKNNIATLKTNHYPDLLSDNLRIIEEAESLTETYSYGQLLSFREDIRDIKTSFLIYAYVSVLVRKLLQERHHRIIFKIINVELTQNLISWIRPIAKKFPMPQWIKRLIGNCISSQTSDNGTNE